MSDPVKTEKKSRDPKPIPLVKGWIDSHRFAESIIVNNVPMLLIVDIKARDVSIVNRIGSRFRPLERGEMGYIPYEFASLDEIRKLWSEDIRKEDLLDGILEAVQRFVDMPRRDQILLTGDTFLTYCMEWTSTVHFLFFVGPSGSGKTTSTYIPRELGYRCMAVGQMTSANIYNFLGTAEEGCGCICEDEAQDIGNDKEKMRIYKSAYSKGQKIPKVDTSGKKVQLYYNTYCMVFFSGEGLPEDKAFMERTIVIYMVRGNPKDNIKKPADRHWKEIHMVPLRKKLFFWRLQNIGKEFPRFDSGLTGRDQELFEDFLSIYADTKYSADAGEVVEYYVNQRQETIKDSPEAAILESLILHLNGEAEIEFVQFWQFLTKSGAFSGAFVDKAERTYRPDHSDDMLTYNSVSKMLVEKFGAKKRSAIRTVDGKRKKITYYVFDKEALKTHAEKYHIDDPNVVNVA